MSNLTTVYYAYRQVIADPTPRYIIPCADPAEHEYPFDHIFDTPEEAKEHLAECIEDEMYGDELVEADLVLVKVTEEPVSMASVG